MGFALALGQFVGGAANQLQKDQAVNQQSDLEEQRMLMQDWANTVLPQVQRQRQADNANLSVANNAMATDPNMKNQPLMAFHYATLKSQGIVKDLGDYYDKVNTGAVQPAVQQQVNTLQSQGFQVQRDADGNVISLAFSPTSAANTAAPVPGAGQGGSLADHILGRKPTADVVQSAANKFAGATNIDPTQGVTSKFDNTVLTGLNAPMKSPKSEKLQMEAIQAAKDNPQYVQNFGTFMSTLASGDQSKITALLEQPGFIRSRQSVEADQFNKQFRLNMAEHLGEFKNPGEVATLIANGGSTGDIMKAVASNSYTLEEKQALQEKMIQIDRYAGDLTNPDAVLLMNQSGVLNQLADKGLIGKAAIPAMVSEAQKLHDDRITLQNRMMGQFGQTTTAPQTPDQAQQPAAPPAPAPGATYSPQGPQQPAQPPVAQTPAPQPQGGLTDPLVNQQPQQSPGQKVSYFLHNNLLRPGDSPQKNAPYDYGPDFQDHIEHAAPEALRHNNPLANIQAAQHEIYGNKNAKEAAKILGNSVFLPKDQAALAKNPRLAAQLNDTIIKTAGVNGGFTYASEQEAAEKVPVNGLYHIEGTPPTAVAFMTQAIKAKYATQGQ